MKMKLIVSVLMLTGLVVTFPGWPEQTRRYCGKVVTKSIVRKTGKYRYYIFFYSEELKRTVLVETTTPEYNRTIINNRKCFDLTKEDLRK